MLNGVTQKLLGKRGSNCNSYRGAGDNSPHAISALSVQASRLLGLFKHPALRSIVACKYLNALGVFFGAFDKSNFVLPD